MLMYWGTDLSPPWVCRSCWCRTLLPPPRVDSAETRTATDIQEICTFRMRTKHGERLLFHKLSVPLFKGEGVFSEIASDAYCRMYCPLTHCVGELLEIDIWIVVIVYNANLWQGTNDYLYLCVGHAGARLSVLVAGPRSWLVRRSMQPDQSHCRRKLSASSWPWDAACTRGLCPLWSMWFIWKNHVILKLESCDT